ncbi:MAG: hypothetical protein WCB99_12780 [Candidatus Cybelea sp.]|jgi:hypothetical protein
MKILSGAARDALGICAAATLLAGCGGGSQAQIGLPEVTQRNAPLVIRHPAEQGSWMSPRAQHEDLLYVSNLSNDSITVYGLLGHKMLGKLEVDDPYGVCSDNSGNVWVISAYNISEYAHAGTKPIKTLHDPNGDPYDCAVDPTTGNLAVTNWSGAKKYYQGNVAIYAHASGEAKLYTGSGVWYFYGCTYDDQGNLFTDGWDWYLGGNLGLAELHKGGRAFKELSMIPSITPSFVGSIQWDGKYLAISNWGTVYQYGVSGSYAKVKGYTLLSYHPIGLFWIPRSTPQAKTIIASQVIGGHSMLHHWNYPAGGDPTFTVTDGLDGPYSVTLSKVVK